MNICPEINGFSSQNITFGQRKLNRNSNTPAFCSRLKKFYAEEAAKVEGLKIEKLQEPLTDMIVEMLQDPKRKNELLDFGEKKVPIFLKAVKNPIAKKLLHLNEDVIKQLDPLPGMMQAFRQTDSEEELRPMVKNFAGNIISIAKQTGDIPDVPTFKKKMEHLNLIINPTPRLAMFVPQVPQAVKELHANCIKVAKQVQADFQKGNKEQIKSFYA